MPEVTTAVHVWKDRQQVLIDVENKVAAATCELYDAMSVDCNCISVRDVTFIGKEIEKAVKAVQKAAKAISALQPY